MQRRNALTPLQVDIDISNVIDIYEKTLIRCSSPPSSPPSPPKQFKSLKRQRSSKSNKTLTSTRSPKSNIRQIRYSTPLERLKPAEPTPYQEIVIGRTIANRTNVQMSDRMATRCKELAVSYSSARYIMVDGVTVDTFHESNERFKNQCIMKFPINVLSDSWLDRHDTLYMRLSDRGDRYRDDCSALMAPELFLHITEFIESAYVAAHKEMYFNVWYEKQYRDIMQQMRDAISYESRVMEIFASYETHTAVRNMAVEVWLGFGLLPPLPRPRSL